MSESIWLFQDKVQSIVMPRNFVHELLVIKLLLKPILSCLTYFT